MNDEGPILRCDLVPQYRVYRRAILSAVERVLDSGRYTLGDEGAAFEREFGEYLGVPHVIGVANGTDGLSLALKALGVGPGDEVVTTPYTAIPTVSAVVAVGATPVFADVDPDTYLVDVEKMAAKVTDRTKVILPVHIFGNVVDVRRLRHLVPDRVRIVEDAAQAHGSSVNGEKAGTLGDVGVFSFYPTKNLGGYGDGGAVVTSDPSLDEQLRLLRTYGMTDKDHTVIHGINSRLDELQAAILRVKLRHLDDMNALRRGIAIRYEREVAGSLLRHPVIPRNVVTNYHVYVARVLGGRRNALVEWLAKHDIQSNVYYVIPLHLQEATRGLGYARGDLPVAETLCDQTIALPMYAELPGDVSSRVIACLNDFARAQEPR